MQLPFVLQSAEVMKAAVRHLEPKMERVEGSEKGSILLATVAGDVHDIGKNLVDIILSNNGYRVVNIGIKQPVNTILEQAQANNVQVIGMSGLLVKSTLIMRDNLLEMNERKLHRFPVILGGAALTRGYVEEDLRAVYRGQVYYAQDAFEGLRLMESLTGESGIGVPADGPAGVSPAEITETSSPDCKGFVPPDPEEPVMKRAGSYLPHWRVKGGTYLVTFRLADSLPEPLLEALKLEAAVADQRVEQGQTGAWEAQKARWAKALLTDRYLDQGLGSCLLSRPEAADIVRESLLHFDGNRYDLLAYAVMPNHVHVLVRPHEGHELAKILHSWKSFSSHKLKSLAQGTGPIWKREYYDHIVRDEVEFSALVDYIESNPAKAGLNSWTWVSNTLAELRGRDALGTTSETDVPPSTRVASHRVGVVDPQLYVFDGATSDVAKDVPVPHLPFYGARKQDRFDIFELYKYINTVALWRGQWQFKKQEGMSNPEFTAWLEENVRPVFERKQRELARVLRPRVKWGYFWVQSQGNDLIVYQEDAKTERGRFTFPRQRDGRRLCLSDYFRSVTSGVMDVAAFHIVTVGHEVSELERRQFAEGDFQEYLYTHGMGVETAEALAEYWHLQIRHELGIDDQEPEDLRLLFSAKYHGARFSFGYPACPNLEDQAFLMELLQPEDIGIELSEEFMLVPEQSTSAIIVHHPEAKYFNVR
jgi:cobalamin-dependent methionine synthase I